MKRTLFWNVDTQYDFMSKTGALYVPGAESIEGNLERLTKHAARHNIKVVNTADWHNEKTEEISDKPDFVMTFPKHCMEYTFGAEYIPATRPENPLIINWEYSENWNGKGDNVPLYYGNNAIERTAVAESREFIVRKDKFGAFAGNPWTSDLVGLLDPERVIVYGVATNYCVNWAVQGLVKKGVEVYVVTDAIKELPLPKENGWNHENVIRQWTNSGVRLITTDEVLKSYR